MFFNLSIINNCWHAVQLLLFGVLLLIFHQIVVGVAKSTECRQFVRDHRNTRASKRIELKTKDGWTLSLYRYGDDSVAGLKPVLLIHGLSSNRLAYDFVSDPETPSLALYLSKKLSSTHRVYVIELRGSGLTMKHNEPKNRDFNFDRILDLDVEAALDFLATTHRGQPLTVCGHSMGGMLSLCALGTSAHYKQIKKVVSIGSFLRDDPVSSGTVYSRLARLRRLCQWLLPATARIPIGLLHRVEGSLSHVFPGLLDFQFADADLAVVVRRQLYATGFHGVPLALMLQLGTAASPQGMRRADGSDRRYIDLINERGHGAQILMVAGSGDVQCLPRATLATAGQLQGDVTVRSFGRREHVKTPNELGHFDLLLSPNALDSVFPVILNHIRN